MAYQPADFQVTHGQLVVQFNEAGIQHVRIEGAVVKTTDPDLPAFRTQDVNIKPDQIPATMHARLVTAMKRGAVRRANKEDAPVSDEAL